MSLTGIRKSKQRQDVLILDEYGSVTEDALEVEAGKGYAADDDRLLGWAVDGNNKVKSRETGKYTQLLVSWSVMPITLNGTEGTKITKDNINAIASAKEDEELQFISRKHKEDSRSKWLAYTAFGIIAVDALLGIWMLLSSGTLKLPWS